MKKINKIVVMPVRNEEWILEKTLSALSLFADHIIVADHNSTDRTVEICRAFEKVRVIKYNDAFHSSNVRKMLLDTAREIKGDNVIFSFDADEVPTPHMLHDEFWQKISELPQGSAIEMQWVNLWNSAEEYRNDQSVWSNRFQVFGFVDDRTCEYISTPNDFDHVSRVPGAVLKNIHRLDYPKVLHFQFIDLHRVLLKQKRYRVNEYLQRPKGILTALKVNVRYFSYGEEAGFKTDVVPEDWVKEYETRGLDLKHFPREDLTWYELDILKSFKEYGPAYFKWLDIWDIDWEEKRKIAMAKNMRDVSSQVIVDPRPFYITLYHKHLQSLFGYNSVLYRGYRYCIKFVK